MVSSELNKLNNVIVKMKALNMAEIWDICRNMIYDKRRYVKDLNKILEQEKINNIHITGCGTGDISIELFNIGYAVSCSDNNEEMLSIFRRKLRRKNIKEIPIKKIGWKEQSKYYKQEFDCVYCGGNSLVWVDSWGKQETPNQLSSIKDALSEFYQITKPEGILIIDIYKNDFNNNSKNNQESRYIGKTKINQIIEKWYWETELDWNKKERKWRIRRVNQEEETLTSSTTCYLPTHQEVIEMIKEAGFKTIEKINLEGTPYTVYMARKSNKI